MSTDSANASLSSPPPPPPPPPPPSPPPAAAHPTPQQHSHTLTPPQSSSISPRVQNRIVIIGLACAAAPVLLWLWTTSVMIAVESNKSPAVPSSTPCAALNSSMMPSKFQMSLSLGNVWHARTFVKPFAWLEIVAEQRCFANGVGAGSSLLWVNNQLAAFSVANGNTDQIIYDCHGQRLFEVCNSCWIDKKPKAKAYSDGGDYILASDRPSYKKDQIIYGQPEDLVVASLSSDNEFTILNAQSAAADPRLLIMMYSSGFFTRSSPRGATNYDGCNSFVIFGGIFSFCAVMIPAIFFAIPNIVSCISKFRNERNSAQTPAFQPHIITNDDAINIELRDAGDDACRVQMPTPTAASLPV